MPRPIDNPPNPWDRTTVEYLGEPPPARLVVYEERAKSIISDNDSPDLDFRHGLNPYRGCVHACAYCYARPTHQYLGFGAGTDFDRKIVVKVNAPELLRREISKKTWDGGVIVMSGVTDCYQALEASYELTRRCLQVCAEHRQPIAIITKGALVARDVDLLARLAREASAMVYFSVAVTDDLARALEPWAPKPSRRYAAMRQLTDAGVRTGVSLAPIIPGVNDALIPELLEHAREAGASEAFMTLVRLPREVLPVFEARLDEALPLRANKVRAALREMRNGELDVSRFGDRMVGVGPRWQMIEALFRKHAARLGMQTGDDRSRCEGGPDPTSVLVNRAERSLLARSEPPPPPAPIRAPRAPRAASAQAMLFDLDAPSQPKDQLLQLRRPPR